MRQEIREKIAAAPDTQVQLNACQITDDELPEIIEEIKRCKPNAVSFFLDKNQISEQGAILLAKHLMSTFKNIENLMLQNNQINEAGIRKLCELRTLPHFKVLAIHGNQVIDEGRANEIAQASSRSSRRPF